jgi:transcriptional regulator with XRE-family HTH domain
MKLVDYLRVNQITQAEFAARIGTTAATVNRIVRGKVTPRRALMTTICEVTKGEVQPLDLLLD